MAEAKRARLNSSVTFAQAFDAADDVFQVSRDASDEELQEFINQCCK